MTGDPNGTFGTIRRIDSAPTPDRHPASVRWPDERRPRPRPVDLAPEPVGAPGGIGRARHPEAPVRRDEGRYDRDHRTDRGVERRPVVSGRSQGAAAPMHGGVGAAFLDQLVGEEHRAPPDGPLGGGGGGMGRHRSPHGARQRHDRVEANARLTGSTAAVLLVLLAVEGLTVLSIRSLLSVHVFVGMLLVPPVVLKIGSTMWRFAHYYLGDPDYRRKGPPAPLLRLLGPVVVVLTVSVLGTGIALLVVPLSMRTSLLFWHKATFVIWLMAMAVHVLAHLLDTAKLAPRDWYHRTRRQVRGASLRQWVVATSVAIGLVLGAVMLPQVGVWLAEFHLGQIG